ncbi:MAG: hypothetical protein WCE79_11240 [Xanthobacteraceae bacterium]
MTRRVLAFVGLAVAMLLVQDRSVYGFETAVSESSCRAEGFKRPLRQTIIVVDEGAIEAISGKPSQANLRLNRTILNIAGVLEGQPVALSAPRERLTLLFAREDGSDLIRALVGCPPTYSDIEINQLEKDSSGLSGQFKKFIGRDVRTNVEKEKQGFQTLILQTMVELAKLRSAPANTRKDTDIGFLRALALIRGNVDLNYGVPRIVVISPMNIPAARSFNDVKTAREKGFDLAEKIGADLQRAEVYLVGHSRETPGFTREFAHALFLGMKGRLAAVGGEALPAFADAPNSVAVYTGSIDYGDRKVPMQMRLAVDKTGLLVNSWVEVSVLRPVATPLVGNSSCKNSAADQCDIVTGNGSEFSQSWVTDIKPTPTFNEKLPFSGARFFELSTTSETAKGRVRDPNLVMMGKKGTPFILPFELSLATNTKF